MSFCMQEELGKFRLGTDDVEIFFSAHGVPLSYVEEAGDPYKVHILWRHCLEFTAIAPSWSLGCRTYMPWGRDGMLRLCLACLCL